MTTVFADTFYWVALANPRDRWHERAKAISESLRQIHLLTTDEVLVEFLTQFGSLGPGLRLKAAECVRAILNDPCVDVLPQTHDSFLAGLTLYEARPDKGYSLTDCISMNAMKNENLTDVLTYDEHFRQEGFKALFRE